MFEIPAALLSWFYGLTNSYTIAIALIAAVVMAITTPLTLKSTKGMLEMQKLAPEMRKLQNEYRSDRQKLNEEMMKLYQEHKVNPMASCLPLVAQMPVFIIMFRVLRGLTYSPRGSAKHEPALEKAVSHASELAERHDRRARRVDVGRLEQRDALLEQVVVTGGDQRQPRHCHLAFALSGISDRRLAAACCPGSVPGA